MAGAFPGRISLPTPVGEMAAFTLFESPIMAAELADKFPEIRTYAGQGVDDPTATLRLDISPAGVHAQVLSATSTFYIDPYFRGYDKFYASYFPGDLKSRPIAETLLPSKSPSFSLAAPSTTISSPLAVGAELRKYDLALAATAEYTQFHGGTVADGLNAIVTAVNRVNGIYERAVAVRFELVAENDQLVYTDAALDPYTNNDADALADENQQTVDSIVGAGNYDIGHVLSTGTSATAALGVVGVEGQKAKGVTGNPQPVGDAFLVDHLAHEIGHQFGANHTFNGLGGNCANGSRNPDSAFEPGSGSTVFGYAGRCGDDDLQSNSDPYFHASSFHEIVSYSTQGVGSAVADVLATGNNVPQVDGGADYVIPADTAFALAATGSDPDPGDVLTYSWEQMD
ncbi:MAG: hypothetical protein KDA42_17350, partial [Planctomycetales bacterium]|nr:hypothetical protein [Planctomycetales bacterium]